MPLTTIKKVDLISKDGELLIKYLPGYPRSYRFDASRRRINENEENVLTQKGEAFSFIPIGYRKFSDDILRFGILIHFDKFNFRKK